MRVLISLIGLAGLGACAATDSFDTVGQVGDVDLRYTLGIAALENHLDVPFDAGTVYVVANEHGDLHTYSLTPCGENRICGPDGRAGQLERTPDFFVVTGAYRDRTFFLSRGGDGYLTWRGENRDLAWN